jgi:hypothetical protein
MLPVSLRLGVWSHYSVHTLRRNICLVHALATRMHIRPAGQCIELTAKARVQILQLEIFQNQRKWFFFHRAPPYNITVSFNGIISKNFLVRMSIEVQYKAKRPSDWQCQRRKKHPFHMFNASHGHCFQCMLLISVGLSFLHYGIKNQRASSSTFLLTVQ